MSSLAGCGHLRALERRKRTVADHGLPPTPASRHFAEPSKKNRMSTLKDLFGNNCHKVNVTLERLFCEVASPAWQQVSSCRGTRVQCTRVPGTRNSERNLESGHDGFRYARGPKQ
eukprot:3918190-Rhodomonas_salina.1